MTRLGQAWESWLGLLRHREVGTGLALLRILVGLILLRELVGPIWYGCVDLLWFTIEDGGYRAAKGGSGWRWLLLGGYSPAAVYTMLATGIVASICTTLGVFGRLAPLVGLQAFIALTRLNSSAGGGDDYLVQNMLWVLVLADATATGSLAAKRRTGVYWPEVKVAAWPRYLVIVQLIVMYTSTGFQKMSHHWVPWGDLSALWYALLQPSWQRFDLSELPPSVFVLTQAATLGTWLFEVGAPVLWLAFWYRYTRDRPGTVRRWFNRLDIRSWFLLFGLGMHAGIFILMDVGAFSLISVATYTCAYHADEYRALVRRFRPAQPTT